MSYPTEEIDYKKLYEESERRRLKAEKKAAKEAERAAKEAERATKEAERASEIQYIIDMNNKYNVPLSFIYEGQMPKFLIKRVNKSETAAKSTSVRSHKSDRGMNNGIIDDHNSLEDEVIDNYTILENGKQYSNKYNYTVKKLPVNRVIYKKLKFKDLDKMINEERIKYDHSKFLKNNDYLLRRRIEFMNESTIREQVANFCSDILAMMDLTSILTCYTEPIIKTVSTRTDKNLDRPDAMIVRTRQKRPNFFLEVKPPVEPKENPRRWESYIINPLQDLNKEAYDRDLEGIFQNQRILGQAYDYLVNTRTFCNETEIKGVITTLKHWMFVWLPRDPNLDFNKREMYVSDVYEFSHPDLPKLLISSIYNSYHSQVYPVNLFDIDRSYIEFDSRSWRWKKIGKNDIKQHLKHFNFNIIRHSNLMHYTIIKYFDPGNEAQTSIILSKNSSIGVMKQFFHFDEDKIFNEANNWNKIYDLDIKIIKMDEISSMILPFIFTPKYSDLFGGTMVFQFDLMEIFTTRGAIPGELPKELEKLQNDLYEMSEHLNVRDIGIKAIKHFASKGYIHKDLEFRHIGLLPLVDNSKITGFKPVLIDLEYIEESSSEDALEEMLSIFEILCHGYNF